MGFVSSLALYSSPLWTSAQMLEAARSSRHGCKLGGGVWNFEDWNERLTITYQITYSKLVNKFQFLACGAPAPHRVILLGMAPQNTGYINRSSCYLTPQDNYLRTMNYDLHTIPICQLSWTTSSTPAVNVLPANFRKVITQFCPIFSVHDALTDIVCSCSIDNDKFKHRSVQFPLYSLVTGPY